MMLTSRRSCAWPIVSLIVTVYACGDDAGEADFPVESGIARGRALGELAPAEMTRLCEAAVATTVTFFQSDATIDYACTLAASLQSLEPDASTLRVSEEACTEARKECEKLPEPGSITSPDCASMSIHVPSTCHATVGEYEACLERLFEALANDWRSTTCNSLSNLTLQEWPGAHVTSPAQLEGCARVALDCTTLPWPSVKGAYGRANERSTAVRNARAAGSGGR